eukprot:TRINITY_DN727_c0_g3_i1.p1 TRINITY_DN727_c0_g3~~TRINITY_DN727_c0_g3_i1.p1  ORF type:complete len:883 (+),score=107.85 TRINITY_DN727_c0_g3_i1:1021-3669(+)
MPTNGRRLCLWPALALFICASCDVCLAQTRVPVTKQSDFTDYPPIFSHNGRCVVLSLLSPGVLPVIGTANNGVSVVFDRTSGKYQIANVRPEGFNSRDADETGFVSDDGKWYIFSITNYPTAPFKYGTSAVYLRNLQTSTTYLVSPTVGNYSSDPYFVYGLSADGSWAVLSETSIGFQLYQFTPSGSVAAVYPILVDKNGTTVTDPINIPDRIPVPQLSANGRFFLFTTNTDRLDSLDTNGWYDTYLYDRSVNKTRWATNFDGREGYSDCYGHALSSNGRFAAFRCTPAVNSGNYDITVVMDLSTGLFWNTNVDANGDQVTTGGVQATAVSDDGLYVTHSTDTYYSNATRSSLSIIPAIQISEVNSIYQLMSSSGSILHVIQNLTSGGEWGYLQFETSTGEISQMTELSCQYEDARICDLSQYQSESSARPYGLSLSADGRIVIFSNTSLVPVYFNTSSNIQSSWMLSPGVPFDGYEVQPGYRTALNEDGSIMVASRITSSQTGCSQSIHIYDTRTLSTTALKDTSNNCVTTSNDVQVVRDCVVFVTSAIMFEGDDSEADLYCYNITSGTTSVLASEDGNVDPSRPVTGGYISKNLKYVLFSVGSPAELYLHDTSTGTSMRVDYNGTTPFNALPSGKYFVSENGNFIAFDVYLGALGRTGNGFAVLYRTLPDGLLQVAEPTREAISSSGFSGSIDGRFLVYTVPDGSYENNYAYIAVLDTTTGQVASLPGPLIQASTYGGFISSDGNTVAFVTTSRGLGPVDFDFTNDAYVCSRNFSSCKIASVSNGYYATLPAAPVQPPLEPPVESPNLSPESSPTNAAAPSLPPVSATSPGLMAPSSDAPSRAPTASTGPEATSSSSMIPSLSVGIEVASLIAFLAALAA